MPPELSGRHASTNMRTRTRACPRRVWLCSRARTHRSTHRRTHLRSCTRIACARTSVLSCIDAILSCHQRITWHAPLVNFVPYAPGLPEAFICWRQIDLTLSSLTRKGCCGLCESVSVRVWGRWREGGKGGGAPRQADDVLRILSEGRGGPLARLSRSQQRRPVHTQPCRTGLMRKADIQVSC